MNNKGQVLISFIILIPLFIMLIAVSVDMGELFTEKRKIENNIKFSITNNFNDEVKLKKQITSNIKDIDVLSVQKTTDYLTIQLKKRKKSLFGSIFKFMYYDIDLKYKGIIKDGKVKIEKVEG